MLATFGTATTVDYVRWDEAAQQHCFEGGVIVPGLALMLSALHQGTAQLPALTVEMLGQLDISQHAVVPQTTTQALLYGAVLAQVATVQAMLARCGMPQLLLAGGYAAALQCEFERVQQPSVRLVQSVLAGLERYALACVANE